MSRFTQLLAQCQMMATRNMMVIPVGVTSHKKDPTPQAAARPVYQPPKFNPTNIDQSHIGFSGTIIIWAAALTDKVFMVRS